ncbi:FAD-dependent oxidoreductase, partial [Isoptericola sp. QY 916]|nr:FAD-dependent oxidoreductase [Isoptericola sp. QY 916]
VLVGPAKGSPATVPPGPGEVDAAERVVVRRADGRDATLLVRPDGYLADARVPAATSGA